jgi:hypothetical protein
VRTKKDDFADEKKKKQTFFVVGKNPSTQIGDFISAFRLFVPKIHFFSSFFLFSITRFAFQ